MSGLCGVNSASRFRIGLQGHRPSCEHLLPLSLIWSDLLIQTCQWSVMDAVGCWSGDGYAEEPTGSRQAQNHPDAARGHLAVCFVLAAAQRLPFGERRGRFGRTHATQFDRFPGLPLAGHVIRVLQSICLLLAQRQFPPSRQNVRKVLSRPSRFAAAWT